MTRARGAVQERAFLTQGERVCAKRGGERVGLFEDRRKLDRRELHRSIAQSRRGRGRSLLLRTSIVAVARLSPPFCLRQRAQRELSNVCEKKERERTKRRKGTLLFLVCSLFEQEEAMRGKRNGKMEDSFRESFFSHFFFALSSTTKRTKKQNLFFPPSPTLSFPLFDPSSDARDSSLALSEVPKPNK